MGHRFPAAGLFISSVFFLIPFFVIMRSYKLRPVSMASMPSLNTDTPKTSMEFDSNALDAESLRTIHTGVTSLASKEGLKTSDLEREARALKLAISYSSQVLHCVKDMSHQEDEEILLMLESLVGDIEQSVPYNTYKVPIRRLLQAPR